MSFDPDKYLAQKKQLQQKTAAPSSIEPEVTDSASVENIKDVLAGAAQGATFGFGDEALAAIQATLDKPENVSWYEEYRKKQKENEEAYKQMQERSPWLTMGGELAGGFAIPGGMFLKGAKAATATAGSKALQEAMVAGKTLEEATDFAKKAETTSKLLQSAKAGAGVGALTGIGASEKTIEELPELAKEGLSGAAVGGIIGGAATKTGQFVKGYIDESPKIQRALRVFELEKGGTNLTTEKGQDKIYKEFQQARDSTVNELTDLFETQKAKLNDLFREHGSEKVSVSEMAKPLSDFVSNADDVAQQSINKIFGSNYLRKITDNELTLSDLNNLRSNILSSAKNYAKELGNEGMEFIYGNKLKQKPGFLDFINKAIDNQNSEIAGLRKNITDAALPVEQLLTKTEGADAVHKRISDYTDAEVKDALQKIVGRRIESLANLGFTGVKGRGSMGFLESLKDVESRLGKPGMSEGLEQKLRASAKDISALKSQIGEKPYTSDEGAIDLFKNLTPSGIVGGGFAQMAGKIGRVESNLGQPISKLLKMGKATTAQLEGFAKVLRDSNVPGVKKLGENAAAAFESGDAASKAAMLNAIMQNPEARKLIGVNTGEE